MKNQKIKFAAVAILSLALLAACKKGENDPFLSLKSRNARITGTWKLTSQSTTQTDVNNGVSDVYRTTYDGTNLTITDDQGGTNTISYSQSIEIKKDGTYKMTRIEDGNTQEFQGNWWWLNSKKKKVRIAFDDDWGSFYIDRLKNKELVLKIDEAYSESQSGFSFSSTSSGTWEYEKK